MLLLREPGSSDWDAILRVACEAVPNAPDGNAGWLNARKSFDASARTRHHYVGEDGQMVIAYGAIEQDVDARRWRLFIVMSPERLAGEMGSLVFDRLIADLQVEHAKVAWAREHADDVAFAEFARARGFTEAARFVIDEPTAGAYQGVEVVEYELALAV